MTEHASRGESRRGFTKMLAGAGACALLPASAVAQAPADAPLARPIPSSDESIPSVGVGTAIAFDVGADAGAREKLAQVLQALVAGGGRVVDTASAYGSAESVVGDLVAAANLRSNVFVATKLVAPDPAELARSLARLRTDRVDLLQFHNVRDAGQSLARFREWKAQGACRYVGITSTFHRDFEAVEAVIRRERPDFVQLDYSLDNREVEARLLPAAADSGCAVLTALPFGRNRLFRAVRERALPDWAGEFDAHTWGQFFLKFLLGDPRVTCVIPGTSNAAHVTDNLGAARGRLPDAAQRRRMIEFVQSL